MISFSFSFLHPCCLPSTFTTRSLLLFLPFPVPPIYCQRKKFGCNQFSSTAQTHLSAQFSMQMLRLVRARAFDTRYGCCFIVHFWSLLFQRLAFHFKKVGHLLAWTSPGVRKLVDWTRRIKKSVHPFPLQCGTFSLLIFSLRVC